MRGRAVGRCPCCGNRMTSRPGEQAPILYGQRVCRFCYEDHVRAPGAETLLVLFVLAPWVLALVRLLLLDGR